MSLLKSAIQVAVLSFAASSAFAADGAIEINAACVATGCFSGDDPGFPVQAHRSGKYILTSNLYVGGGGSAIDARNNVTLDLNGFTVSGSNTCSGYPAVTSCIGSGGDPGIDLSTESVVKNGVVKNFDGYGISASDFSLVTGVTVSGNAGGGITAQRAKVTNSFVVRNGGRGIAAATPSGGQVENTHVAGNESHGIYITKGLVRGNRVEDNGGYGLSSHFGTKGTAYGNNQFAGNNGGSGTEVIGGFAIACNLLSTSVECPPPGTP